VPVSSAPPFGLALSSGLVVRRCQERPAATDLARPGRPSPERVGEIPIRKAIRVLSVQPLFCYHPGTGAPSVLAEFQDGKKYGYVARSIGRSRTS